MKYLLESNVCFDLIYYLLSLHRFYIELEVKWSLPTVTIIIFLYKYAVDQIPRTNGAILFYGSTFLVNLAFVFILMKLVTKIAAKPKIKD